MTRNEKIGRLCDYFTDSWDLNDLIRYANQKLVESYEETTDEELNEVYEEYFGDID